MNGKTILITGGTGSFGKKFLEIVLKKYENLLILRTVSKSFGLPSIRLGYILGNKKIISICRGG